MPRVQQSDEGTEHSDEGVQHSDDLMLQSR